MVILHDALSLKIANKVLLLTLIVYVSDIYSGSISLHMCACCVPPGFDVPICANNDNINQSQISAHRSRLVALAFSLDGTRLATASEQGTVIRVFR